MLEKGPTDMEREKNKINLVELDWNWEYPIFYEYIFDITLFTNLYVCLEIEKDIEYVSSERSRSSDMTVIMSTTVTHLGS